MNLRTMQRLAKAAAEGSLYPIVPGTLQSLADLLDQRSAKCAAAAADLGGASSRPNEEARDASDAHAEIRLTPEALTAGATAIEEAPAHRPSRMARAAFLAIAAELGIAVVAPD